MYIVIGTTCPLFLSDINQIVFSGYNLKKTLKHQIFKNLSIWSLTLPHTDMAEANGRFPKFRERDHKLLPLHANESLVLVISAYSIINILNEVYQLYTRIQRDENKR